MGKKQKIGTGTWINWLLAHPYGQLVLLFAFTVPIGIVSLVFAQDSYDKLNDAVAAFKTIIDNWKLVPVIDVAVANFNPSGSSCPSGYEPAFSMTWPGARSGPCACPSTSYQPFNRAEDSDLTSALRYVYGTKRSTLVGYWQTTRCSGKKLSSSGYVYDGPQSCGSGAFPCGAQLCSNGYPGSCAKTGSSISCTNTQCYTPSAREFQEKGCDEESSRRRKDRRKKLTDFDIEFNNTYESDITEVWMGSEQSQRRSSCFNQRVDSCGAIYCTKYKYTVYDAECTPVPYGTSSASDCSGDQRLMNCQTDNGLTQMALSVWRGSVICFKRGGDPAIDSSGAARPDPQGGSCPSGWKKCGVGDYNTNRATCARDGGTCPVTELQVKSPTENVVAAEWTKIDNLDAGYKLAWRRADKTQAKDYRLPISTLYEGLQRKCVEGQDIGYSFGTFSGTTSALSWNQGFNAASTKTCATGVDARFKDIDTTSSANLLQDNINIQYCGVNANRNPGVAPSSNSSNSSYSSGSYSSSRRGWNSQRRSASMALQWSSNGGASGKPGYPYLYNVDQAIYSTPAENYCANGDVLCKTLMSRTNCNKLQEYAKSASNNAYTAKIMSMAEIFYKVEDGTCATKKQLYDATPEIEKLRDATFAQLVIQYCAFFGGFILNLLAIYRDYIGMDDDSEEDDFWQNCAHRIAYTWAIFMKLGTLIAICIAFVADQKAIGVFGNSADCTDAISAEQGFSEINGVVESVHTNVSINMSIECIMILFTCYSIYSVKAFSEEIEVEEEPAESTGYCGCCGGSSKDADAEDGEKKDKKKHKKHKDEEIQMDNASNLHDTAVTGQIPGEAYQPSAGGEWTMYQNQEGRPYWYNAHTGVTTWDDPRGGPAAAPQNLPVEEDQA
jgi:hypothetical protein